MQDQMMPMMMRGSSPKKIILPLGTSGSGKSTWINSLPADRYVVISPDEMRVEFTGDMNDKI
jgi:predicted kinase